ncbi:hypothetical protein [Streptomyces sp. NRRL F-5727]|uniref:hypothetical protein n=1 Tax=Streptomyces sp. NRRL F-5727 TaxID=1463871 RepID=UPI0004C67C3F|nr:hypothetical protein [Streptomyces sp. NRRL F-5727]
MPVDGVAGDGQERDVLGGVQRDGGHIPVPLVVDFHRAGGGDPAETDDLVEVGAADAEAYGGLVGAEGDVPVEERGQIAAAGEGGDLVGVHVGVGRLTAEVDEETGADEVADRGRGHARPAAQQRIAQRGGQLLRSRPGARRSAQGRTDRLRVHGGHHGPDHSPGPASATGAIPDAVAHRHAATGTPSRLAACCSSYVSPITSLRSRAHGTARLGHAGNTPKNPVCGQ